MLQSQCLAISLLPLFVCGSVWVCVCACVWGCGSTCVSHDVVEKVKRQPLEVSSLPCRILGLRSGPQGWQQLPAMPSCLPSLIIFSLPLLCHAFIYRRKRRHEHEFSFMCLKCSEMISKNRTTHSCLNQDPSLLRYFIDTSQKTSRVPGGTTYS